MWAILNVTYIIYREIEIVTYVYVTVLNLKSKNLYETPT